MTRFSKRYLISGISSSLLLAILCGLLLQGEEEFNLLFFALGFAFASIILITYQVLYYYCSGYEISEKGISCQRGVLFKKKSFLEYSRIHAINKKQGILGQIFKYAYLLVDSGSANTATSAEIMIVEDLDTVLQIMDIIKSKQENVESKCFEEVVKEAENTSKTNEKPTNLYEFNSYRKELYILINSLIALIIVAIVLGLGLITISIIYNLVQDTTETLGSILFIFSMCLVGCVVFVVLANTIQAFVGYHNFKLFKENNTIKLNYGLFTKNDNSFQIRRIKAIRVEQGLLKRLFGYASVKIEVIGLGDSDQNGNKTNDIMIPLCKKDEVNEILANIIPEYQSVPKEKSCTSFFSLFSWNLLFLNIFLIFAGVVIFTSLYFTLSLSEALYGLLIVGLIYLFILIIMLGDSYLKYRFEGIGFDEKKITIYHGGFFHTETTILNKSIITLEDVSTPLRRKKGIYSYVVHLRTNRISHQNHIDILDEEVKDELLKRVRS